MGKKKVTEPKDVVDKLELISMEYGFDCFDKEFWGRQPFGVCRLIIMLHDKEKSKQKK